VPGTRNTLDGGIGRDTHLDTLARVPSLEQRQEVSSQQSEIAWGGLVQSHPAECGRDLAAGSGSQS
jgi:hypothetical protein